MIDFETLKSLTIPEGIVTQIAIDGAIVWELSSDGPTGPTVLEVAKVTKTTYAGETSYSDESFILLDIYPKTNGTVTVTYEGLTKTITDTSGAESPNALQVYFGTLTGVSDSVETPASGTLTIEGDYAGFGVGSYTSDSKGSSSWCSCITAVIEFGAVTILPASAFNNCKNITSNLNQLIPKKIKRIEDRTFFQCSGLTGDLIIPTRIKSIGAYAFCTCTGFKGSLVIPESVTSIDNYAFEGCSGLTGDLVIPNSITTINAGAFNSCTGFTGNLVIPNGVTTIGDSAFSTCWNLTGNLVIPESVTSIGHQAFWSCSRFTGDLVIPNGVTTIGEQAFRECEGLSGTITIPESVTSIGTHAFDLTDGLTKIVILATTPPVLTGVLHTSRSHIESITVPAGCGDAYRNAEYWSSYASKIVEAS